MIFLFDGTSDSRKLALDLKNNHYKLMASAVTDEGVFKLDKLGIPSVKGPLTIDKIEKICGDYGVKCIIDATHPYAVNIHSTIFKISRKMNIFSIRYERKKSSFDSGNVFYVKGYREISSYISSNDMNILVTTGTKNLEFLNEIYGKNIYFRVIPKEENIKLLRDSGIPQKNIIAMEGPFSYNMNYYLIKDLEIDVLVTKDSGLNSEDKIRAAIDLGIKVIIIKRPEYENKNIAYEYNEVMVLLKDGGIYPEP